MKKKNTTLTGCVFAAFFIAAALTAEQIVIYLRYLDFDNDLWQRGTPAIMEWLGYILLALTMLFAVAFAMTAKLMGKTDETVTEPFPNSLAVRVAGALVGLSFLGTLVVQLLAIGSDDKLFLYFSSYSRYYVAFVAFMHGVTLLLVLPACLWFFLCVRKKKPTVVAGMLVVLYWIALLLRVYFDMSVVITSPRRTFSILTLIAALLFTLFETRLLLPRKHLFFYYFFAVTAMVATCASGLTNVILNISGHFHDGFETAYYVLELAFSVYIATRLFALSREAEHPDPACETVANETVADETVTEATVADGITEADTPAPEEETKGELSELTEDEVKHFYKTVYAIVAKKHALSENASEEEKEKVKEEAFEIVSAVFDKNDREESISAVRTFLEKNENGAQVL